MRFTAPLALLLTIALIGCTQSDYEDPDALIRDTTAVDTTIGLAAADLIETLENDQRFSTLVAAIDSAELRSTFSSPAPLTIFAPTNDAFGGLDEGVLEGLLQESRRDELRDLLMQHVINGRRMSSDLRGVEYAESMYGADLRVRANGEGVRIENAEVIDVDIQASNGVIHAINRVLTPPEQI
jgi:uncharacterized surface protein with fasciclin (FAS1) repeats